MRLKKLWLYILTPLLVLFGSAALTNTVQAQELKNVITDVKIWDVDNSAIVKPDTNGVYNLSPQKHSYSNYRFAVEFDLSAYDGKLADGDTFTFTIPAPMTVGAKTFELKDGDTQTAVGDVNVVSNGENNGGKVTITLKNLKEYLKKKGGDQVRGVKGTFYTDFSSKKELSEQEIEFNLNETKKKISYKFKVQNAAEEDYSKTIGKTNFNKYSGTISAENWKSPLLNKSGTHVHNWKVRVDPKQAPYDKLEVHDWANKDFSPMQFIPESMTVTAGWFDKTYTLQDKTQLTAGKDYTIQWNESYTEFTVTILNPKNIIKNGKPAAFLVEYNSTAPGDGTKVQNSVEVKGNGKSLTISDDDKDTVAKQSGNSTIASGGTIQLQTGYRITLYKVDEKTQDRLKGAKFKITPPKGVTKAKEETVTTNDKGVAQSEVYTEEDAKKGEFTITEIEAPAGYELDSNPIKVKVGQEGVIKTITNKRTKAKAHIEATKELVGRDLKEGEFEFTLTGPDGQLIETVKNDKDGHIKFSDLEFDTEGKYVYTIAEKAGNAPGITYDSTVMKAEVSVTKDEKGVLQAKVTDYSCSKFTNKYTPAGDTSVTLGAKKVLEGKKLEAGKYSFVLKEGDKELETVTNDADGNVTFKALTYNESQVGTHKYTISEVAGSEAGITYDKTVQEVEVKVEKVSATELKATVSKEAKDLVFTNKYTPAGETSVTLGAKKVLEGKTLEAGKYSFVLKEGDKELETVTNDADGNVTFKALTYNESQVGTHKYTISEVAGSEAG
ncbi:Spy0128 family protein, partial [Streptococcus oralis]|uniref:Spy0128 family protein n=1 Tax=Streptococcus oralis TaxID=1303 RepID=UPI0034A54483